MSLLMMSQDNRVMSYEYYVIFPSLEITKFRYRFSLHKDNWKLSLESIKILKKNIIAIIQIFIMYVYICITGNVKNATYYGKNTYSK